MISTIKKYFAEKFSSPDDSKPSEHQLHLAAAALLFEVSRSDHSIDDAERDKITSLVESVLDLSKQETQEILELAEQEAHESTSLHSFTSLINEHWDVEQKLRLAESLWQVAFADDRLDDHEVHLMRKIQRLLYLPHKPFIAARMRAKKFKESN